jgi:hypothetical protein
MSERANVFEICNGSEDRRLEKYNLKQYFTYTESCIYRNNCGIIFPFQILEEALASSGPPGVDGGVKSCQLG